MGFQKGNRIGKGRPKGVPNKVNAEVKDMVLKALAAAGGEKYLLTQAKENPNAFLTLVGKVLPIQAQVEHGVSQSLADLLLSALKGRS